ncbi:MAG TPA: biopolymer transporter ExbD [Candidatus Acidoferrum sp.]|nr:biopolymer transporter ExbD [Candidatus Acidoferrum sp.]
MKPSLQERLEQHHGHGIDLAPMLDFVLNLLIFFIITSVVVKEAGVQVEKPQSSTAQQLPFEAIQIAITADGQVMYDHGNIGIDGVRATVGALLEAEERPVVVVADRSVPTDLLVRVMDEAKLGGAKSLNIAANTTP